MANITTRSTSGGGATVKNSPLTNSEIDTNFININVDLNNLLGLPQQGQSAAYTLVLSDAGKSVVHPISDNNARTFTIPANASVAFPIGTAVTFVNMINTLTIAITTDTMYLAGTGATGSRTLAAFGIATALKVSSTSWIISGNGLT